MLPRTLLVRLLKVAVICLAAGVLSGCFLRSLFANVIYTTDIAEEVNEIITAVVNHSTIAVCLTSSFSPVVGSFSCTYIVDGEIITSSLSLISQSGLSGVLIDPIILQVPADATDVVATYDNGNGPQPAVTSVRQSFEMEPGQPITAETGTQFLIFEFPPGITPTLTVTNPANGPAYDFAVNFTQRQPISQPVLPVSVKMMLTGKVVVQGHTYYAPLLPCVTSFADIPSLSIPVTTTLVNLQPQLGDVIRLGQVGPCDHVTYDYSNAPPPPNHRLFLPIVRR